VSALIIGGAFVVALLAIVGLVFVLRSEPDVSATPAQPVMQAKPEPVATPVVAAPPVARQANGPQRPVTAQRTALVTQKLDLEEERPSLHHEEEEFAISNGQLHELSVQLSTLHEQAQEFEHRLNDLTDMIRQIEHEQNGAVSFEEEETYTPRNANR
jgi:septal ring factor EnvC (AmiA/AmiB activator)